MTWSGSLCVGRFTPSQSRLTNMLNSNQIRNWFAMLAVNEASDTEMQFFRTAIGSHKSWPLLQLGPSNRSPLWRTAYLTSDRATRPA